MFPWCPIIFFCLMILLFEEPSLQEFEEVKEFFAGGGWNWGFYFEMVKLQVKKKKKKSFITIEKNPVALMGKCE